MWVIGGAILLAGWLVAYAIDKIRVEVTVLRILHENIAEAKGLELPNYDGDLGDIDTKGTSSRELKHIMRDIDETP